MSFAERVFKQIPWPIQRRIARLMEWRTDRHARALSAKDAFTQIYARGRWGSNGQSEFYSGWGSHVEEVVDGYVKAVRGFLATLPSKPHVVDLGCGDFNVGKRIRDLCQDYVACDVVPTLIEHNKSKFQDLQVDFRCLDLTVAELPAAEVAFIRQVLQHLSNQQIQQILTKLSRYKYLVVTEHLPSNLDFVANLDKGVGEGVRASRETPSGVVLTAPPFNFKPTRGQIIAQIPARGGVIQTTLYEV